MSDPFVIGGFTFMGVVCAALPFAFKYSNRKFKSKALAVKLKVIAMEKSIDKDPSNHTNLTYYTPKFEILSGPHKGHQQHSSSSSSFNPHREGDTINGYYDPDKNLLESDATLANHRTFGLLCFAMSPIFLIIAGFLYVV